MKLPNLLDVIVGPDGRVAMPKLAAATAHLNMAIAFAYLQFNKPFDLALWGCYGGFALGHHLLNKASDQVNAFQEKKLDARIAEGPPPP